MASNSTSIGMMGIIIASKQREDYADLVLRGSVNSCVFHSVVSSIFFSCVWPEAG